jgi:hypothetical protein
MSEEINNEEIAIAPVANVDTVIPEEKAEELEVVVEEKPELEKVEEVKEAANEVISATEPSGIETKPGIGLVGDGAMGSTKVEVSKPRKPVAKKVEDKKETVAIYSTRNVTWQGVGKVYFGYNIVTKEQSEQWLKRSHVRLATPEEVAKEFGK